MASNSQLFNEKRRQYLKHLSVLAGGASLAGCTGSGGGQTATPGGQTATPGGQTATPTPKSNWVKDVPQTKPGQDDPLVITNLNKLSGDPAIRHHIKSFEEKYDIPIKAQEIPETQMLTKVRTYLRSQSSSPSVFEMGGTDVLQLGARGLFERVDDFITTYDSWTPGHKKYATWPVEGLPAFDDFPYQEGIYGVPQYGHAWTLFENMPVLEEAGLSKDFTPQTFSEALEAMEQVSDVVENAILMPFKRSGDVVPQIKNLTVRAGGHFYDGANPDFENDGFTKAVDFYLTLFRKGYAPKGVRQMGEGGVSGPYYAGDAAFMIAATVQLFLQPEDLPIDKPAEEITNISVLPKPEGAGDTRTGTVGPVNYPLSVFSKHKVAGAKYQNLVTTKEEQKRELLDEGNMPIRGDVFDMPEVKEKVAYPDVLRDIVGNGGALIYPNPSKTDTLIFQVMDQAVVSEWSTEKTVSRLQSQAEQL